MFVNNSSNFGSSILFVGDYKPDALATRPPFAVDSHLVVNLECAFEFEESGISSKAHAIVYKKDMLNKVAQGGFSVVNVANNHVGDAGVASFDSSLVKLREITGLSIAGLHESPIVEIRLQGIRCGVIACLEPCRARLRKLTKEEEVEGLILAARESYDRLFVTPHWGKEGEYCLNHSPRQRALAKKWIEAGADAVIGHHPHVIQPMNYVAGKPVFYSLGNYQFDHEESSDFPETKIGLAVMWRPGGRREADIWDWRPVRFEKNRVSELASDELRNWNELFSELCTSKTPVSKLALWLQWARRVGPIYIPKSKKSWKKRLKRKWLTFDRAIWLVWCIHPMTLLLTLGALIPCPVAEKQRAKCCLLYTSDAADE